MALEVAWPDAELTTPQYEICDFHVPDVLGYRCSDARGMEKPFRIAITYAVSFVPVTFAGHSEDTHDLLEECMRAESCTVFRMRGA